MNFSSHMKTILCGAVAIAGVSFAGATPASAQSLHAYCDNYAYNEARNRGRGRVLGGAAAGAAAGAIIGGILGGGRGAAIGAGAGAASGSVGGAASKRIRRDRVYQIAYQDCINANSRRQAPRPARGGYEPWTPAWYDYCRSRYRSFNPNTGYFTTYSGRQKFCR